MQISFLISVNFLFKYNVITTKLEAGKLIFSTIILDIIIKLNFIDFFSLYYSLKNTCTLYRRLLYYLGNTAFALPRFQSRAPCTGL